MRFSVAFLAGATLALSAASGAVSGAAAQTVRGDEVSVNPVGAAGTTLLYPGGQYARVVPHLLEPGERAADDGAIHLHMPSKMGPSKMGPGKTGSRVRSAAVAPRATPHATPRAVTPKKVAAASSPPPASYDGFGSPMGAAGFGEALGPAPASPPPRQVARTEPPGRATPAPAPPIAPGLTKQSVILFASGASEPAQSALDAIKFLAGNLNAAMTSASSRVQIMAYGGEKGDKGSDARRLSLKRALAIRQVLIDDGVPPERIDVRAMGGVDDTGPQDRVDVYVRA